jgi:hypothetical protein
MDVVASLFERIERARLSASKGGQNTLCASFVVATATVGLDSALDEIVTVRNLVAQPP